MITLHPFHQHANAEHHDKASLAAESICGMIEDPSTPLHVERQEEAVELLSATAQETISPLDRLETALHPWVAFFIMPLFALANAGVRVDIAALTSPVSMATAAALALGKPLGWFLRKHSSCQN